MASDLVDVTPSVSRLSRFFVEYMYWHLFLFTGLFRTDKTAREMSKYVGPLYAADNAWLVCKTSGHLMVKSKELRGVVTWRLQ